MEQQDAVSCHLFFGIFAIEAFLFTGLRDRSAGQMMLAFPEQWRPRARRLIPPTA
jgi:hypothetical protein